MEQTQDVQPLGSPYRWAWDMGVLGLVSGAGAPMLFMEMLGASYVIAAGVLGALTGAALGAVMPRLLTRGVARWPIGLLLLVGPLLGFVWGSVVGSSATLVVDHTSVGLWLFGGLVAGLVGAMQFGWVWLPYTWLASKGRARWPLVVVGTVLSVGLGWASLLGVVRGFEVLA